jgi:hypothetical protein
MQNETAPRSAFLMELSENEGFPNSSQKDNDRGRQQINSSQRIMNGDSAGGKSENGYRKTLRPRRNRTASISP